MANWSRKEYRFKLFLIDNDFKFIVKQIDGFSAYHPDYPILVICSTFRQGSLYPKRYRITVIAPDTSAGYIDLIEAENAIISLKEKLDGRRSDYVDEGQGGSEGGA